MKIRCDLHVNGSDRKLVLVPGASETDEHLAMKLAAYLLFWDKDPVVEASARHPALASQEFIPDVMALDAAGDIAVWVECGKVTMHKMTKLSRRLPSAEVLVLKATEYEARRLRHDLSDKVDRSASVRILAFPQAKFREWTAALSENTEVFGEADPRTLNVVVNQRPFVAELVSI